MSDSSFPVWQIDEPEFEEDTDRKLDVVIYPVRLAFGVADGKNDHEVYQSVNVRADWVIRKLFRATIKVAIMCLKIMIKRWVENLWPDNPVCPPQKKGG